MNDLTPVGWLVMDMAPDGFAARRYIVVFTKATPGMMLGPVAAGPFDSEEVAQREADRLEAANPLLDARSK
ncbi:hypothetical protein tb265_38900 [Gemmatimonadetes bacterium T265]|nr:hypothetical protein tb265_38900 [Gemmatimonadetes bacterium T265]